MATENAAGQVAEHAGGAVAASPVALPHTEQVLGFAVNTDTILNSWAIMAVLLVGAFLLARGLTPVPTRKQTVVEGVVEFCQGIVRDQIGPQTAKYIGYIGSLFLFILASNWLGMLPWKAWEEFHLPWWGGAHAYHAPTSDINTTAGLALLSFGAYFFFGIKKKGLSYFKHYLQPAPWLLPFVVLEDLTRPLSLALRLFANVTAGHVVIAVLLMLVPPLVPIPIMGLDLFIGAIQAYIFAVLSASYIGAAVHEAH